MAGKHLIGWVFEISIETHDVAVKSIVGLDIGIGNHSVNTGKTAVNNLKTSFEIFIGCELETVQDMSKYAKKLWVESQLEGVRYNFSQQLADKISRNELKTINGKSLLIVDGDDSTNIDINSQSVQRFDFEEGDVWNIPKESGEMIKGVLTYNNSDDQVIGDIEIENERIRITFSAPVAGYAIILK